MWKNIEKDTTEIVYDNKNLHITELEDTRPVFILFYLLVIKDNDPAVNIWPGRVRGNRQSFSHGLSLIFLTNFVSNSSYSTELQQLWMLDYRSRLDLLLKRCYTSVNFFEIFVKWVHFLWIQ